jgi:hypothetical protein
VCSSDLLRVIAGQIGFGMEKAHGVSLRDTSNKRALRRDFNFRREETWLQLFDCLLGQQDRHSENVFWDNSHIWAIDQDISFPDFGLRLASRFTDRKGRYSVNERMRAHARTINLANRVPLQLYSGKGRAVDGLAGLYNYCMPPVMDEDMRQLIVGLASEELRQFLVSMDLTPGQINAAVNRLESMKGHIDGGYIRVIAPTAWGRDHLPECTPQNSYFMWHT